MVANIHYIDRIVNTIGLTEKVVVMVTLRVRLNVNDYDMWREAFGRDSGGRQAHGATGYRIFRLTEDPNRVELDTDFPTSTEAEKFLEVMRRDVWPDPAKAPAKLGTPEASILDVMETHAY
jgi:hypothetical protein